MKILIFCLLILLTSCASSKKVFLCGDSPCANKKEAKNYFSENLIFEVAKEKNMEDKKTDLITLHNKPINKEDSIFSISNQEKLIKKEILAEEKQLKLNKKMEKLKFKEEEQQIKSDQKLAKSRLKEEEKIIKEQKKNDKKIIKIKNKNKIPQTTKRLSSINKVILNKRACLTANNCDIDQVIETLTKLGNSKDFPKINLK